MRSVAGDASLGLYWGMLPRKWACFIRMTGETDCVLRRGAPQLMSQEAAVRIVAIGARYQAFVYLVVERLGEIRFRFQMAAIAEGGQSCPQKLLLNPGMVDGVAINASNIILQVLRT